MSQPAPNNFPRILAAATQGAGGDDETRLRHLLSNFSPTFFSFNRDQKRNSYRQLCAALRNDRPDIFVLEGSGIAGGWAAIHAKKHVGVPYIISSGDAIAPFVQSRKAHFYLPFLFYERLLYRHCAGFIGWTPYLTGRALALGAKRAITAPGWPPFQINAASQPAARERIRRQYGIASEAIVVGIVGHLLWDIRMSYCYGWELLQALPLVNRPDIHIMIVGDGTGRPHLQNLLKNQPPGRATLTGKVPRDQLSDFLAAFDVAALPQSVDAVGSYRYSTKLAEYLAAGLPVVTSRIPMAYDLDRGFFWRLPGTVPWGGEFIRALAEWLNGLSRADIAAKAAAVPAALPEFDRSAQIARVTNFIHEVLQEKVIS